ncbi:MAG: InlB B-repeat-containing protein, partial [Acetatifactor sp.]|nr:InlB B-repeat-containing protein [Acetatifactor sp.]
MRKRLILFSAVLCLSMSVLLCSCGQSGEQYTICFEDNYGAGGEYDSQVAASGKKIAEPDVPVRDGYVFLGWYKDAGLTEKWDFGKDKVKSEMTLYAGWDADT